ncbi:MAG: 3-hydroxyacyl-CoA dehydrogenase family protein [Pseudonocardiaceae bacterium]
MNVRFGVVGAGVMGVGITQCLIQAGHAVLVVDPDPSALSTGPHRLWDGLRLDRLLGRVHSNTPLEILLSRVRWTDRVSDLSSAVFVIECVRERVPDKERVFGELDAVCPPQAVFASCTSAIPIARLAGFTSRPDRVLGIHFMNPAPLKDTVEVIRAPTTSEETLHRAVELLVTLGKKAIVVSDAPGFVSNRVLMLALNEAATVVQQGTADAEQVDEIFQSCFGHPMGPLRTADLIGLDTVLDTLGVLREHTGDPRFEPCPLLADLVCAGRVGRKSGSGFYDYAAASVETPADRPQARP